MRLSVLARTLEQLTALRKLDSSNESQHQDANADTAMVSSLVELRDDLTNSCRLQFSRRRKSSNSRLSVLEESLTGLTAIEQSLETSDNQIGPLGLNLLYTPPAPLLDFIFVHGLRGGSKKTWSKTSHPYHYWPKEWLPRDPEFKHVRIHSFGYNSDWNDRKDSIINIHDIGKSLLGEMINSPEIRRNDKVSWRDYPLSM